MKARHIITLDSQFLAGGSDHKYYPPNRVVSCVVVNI